MKALPVACALALPLLLTSCYTEGVAYGPGPGPAYRGPSRDYYRRDVRVVERPVYVTRPVYRDRDRHDHDHVHYVAPVRGRSGPPQREVVRKVEIKQVNKYEKPAKYSNPKRADDDHRH